MIEYNDMIGPILSDLILVMCVQEAPLFSQMLFRSVFQYLLVFLHGFQFGSSPSECSVQSPYRDHGDNTFDDLVHQ
jgi:hypothetical protein